MNLSDVIKEHDICPKTSTGDHCLHWQDHDGECCKCGRAMFYIDDCNCECCERTREKIKEKDNV